MSDPEKKKAKSDKSRQAKNTKPATDSSSKNEANENERSVDDQLKELEDQYVTRPPNVRPPLPDANPQSIKRSGIQKAYNPTDINQFPEESVYAMEPFILDEYRLNPLDENFEEESFSTESKTSENDKSAELEESESDTANESVESDDAWEKTKAEFGGEGAWSIKEKSFSDSDIDTPWSKDENVTASGRQETDAYSEQANEHEPDSDDLRDFSLIGEDSIYELEPIVLNEFGFDKLLNPDSKITDDEIPELGPDTVNEHTSEESGSNETVEPFTPDERFPEFSNFEIQPIRIDEQLTADSESTQSNKSAQSVSGERWEIGEKDSGIVESPQTSEIEPGQDPLLGEREVASTLHEVETVDLGQEKLLPDIKPEIETKSDIEEPEDDSLDNVREVAKTIHELDPIEVPVQDRLTLPLEEMEEEAATNLLQPGSDPLSFDDRKVETTIMEVEPIVVDQPLHGEAPEVVAKDEPTDEPEQRRPLIDLAFEDDLTSQMDAIAVQSEKAAIAKEIQTQESLSAVRESAIRQTLADSGLGDVAGQTLEDKYLIRGVIGQGGISVVYKAQDLPTGQIVAVKTLKESNPDVVYRFSKEIETLTKLNHNNIVRAIESISCNDGRVYLIMEHIKGISLQELVKQYGRAEHPEVIATILMQVCDGLGHAHEHKIVHRDLKGGNIVLTNVDDKIVIKILDFGIAKLEDDMQRVTHEGKAMGSPLYMSPEQCRGQPLSIRSDIYSLGIVAYELITGELPVKGRSIVSVMAQHCDPNFRPIPMSKIRPELPGVHMLDQIVFKALETDATKRIQITDQFKRGIEYWIESVRTRKFSRIIPKELLYSEEMEQMMKAPEIDESINEIYEARNTALATGTSYTDVLSRKEREKEKNKSFEEVLTSYKGLKSSVIGAAIMIFLAMVVCIFLIKSMNH